MKPLLNTLYINDEQAHLSLEGESIVITRFNNEKVKVPFQNIENIVCFNYTGASVPLMRACVERQIGICFLSPYGKFQARVVGAVHGNVLLRRLQYKIADDETFRVRFSRSLLIGKIGNSRQVLERAIRDHSLVVNVEKISKASERLKQLLLEVSSACTSEELLALEATAARIYFEVFDELILQQKHDFTFSGRSRRPPLDKVNALLSFLYTILANDYCSALEAVGLDPYVGFFHRDRPGRISLALDLMEELRPILVDRLVLTLINRRQIQGSGFVIKESGGVLMSPETKEIVLKSWQEKKKEIIQHPYLKETIPYGLVPFVQSMLLAKSLRTELDDYPPFLYH